jgi:wobble nucleotide-excising tRNase
MTIEKIVSIKNVGRFLNAAASGDVTFRKHTLVFAENGRGKTTLCAILRSLQSGDPAYIIGRSTLGAGAPPQAQLLAGGAAVRFADGAWDRTLPHLAVFDATFVNDNVYSGEIVDTEQRRNLYRAIIGSQGVTMARRIEELDRDIRAKSTEIREARAALERHIPPRMTIEQFLVFPQEMQIDEVIAQKERELAAVRQAERIARRASLEALSLPRIPPGTVALLAKTLPDVSADAERRVAAQIESHQMAERGESWLSEGLRYVHDDKCPFCAQGLAGVALIEAYKAFFSDAYGSLRTEIAAGAAVIEESFSDRVIGDLQRVLDRNAAGVEFWREFCAFEPPSLPAGTDIPASIAGVRDAGNTMFARKVSAPLEPLVPDANFDTAVRAYETVLTAVHAYNEAVDTANAAIAAKKAEVAAANLELVQAGLARAQVQRTRHLPEVVQACDAHAARQREKTSLEQEKTETRDRLDAHTGQLIERYGRSINHYLDRINAGFRISTPDYTYRGGAPSSSYQVVINDTPVDLGDATTPLNQPSFRNTLSAGDRSTLALAFFFAQIEHDPDRADKIVVLDDPFTSQDNFRRNHTAIQIKRCGQMCSQVVVLSHDPFFLKLVWDKLTPADRKTLQLARVGEQNTAVAEWDIDKATQAQYRADLDVLQRYFTLAEGERRDVIQKLRPVLEAYCRNLYPTQFGDQDSLGVIVGKLRAAGAAHPLAPIADDLDEINEYCRRYHHAENPNAANEPIDDGELNGYVKQTLKLAGYF